MVAGALLVALAVVLSSLEDANAKRRAGPVPVALVNDAGVDEARFAEIAAALEAQVNEDYAPYWGTRAEVAPANAPPTGRWPVFIEANCLDCLGGGYHFATKGGTPFAVVQHVVGDEAFWTTTASHELLEMLTDPGTLRYARAGRLAYSISVGDPVQAFSYSKAGVTVSDFATPAYFVPRAPGPYSFLTGAAKAPLRPACGGEQLAHLARRPNAPDRMLLGECA